MMEQTLHKCSSSIHIGGYGFSISHLRDLVIAPMDGGRPIVLDNSLGKLIYQVNSKSPKMTAMMLESILIRSAAAFISIRGIDKEGLDKWALSVIEDYKFQLYESYVAKQYLDIDLTLSKALLLPENLGLAYYYLQDAISRHSELNENTYKFLIDNKLYGRINDTELLELADRVIAKASLPCRNKYMVETDNKIITALKSIPMTFNCEKCHTVRKLFHTYINN